MKRDALWWLLDLAGMVALIVAGGGAARGWGLWSALALGGLAGLCMSFCDRRLLKLNQEPKRWEIVVKLDGQDIAHRLVEHIRENREGIKTILREGGR